MNFILMKQILSITLLMLVFRLAALAQYTGYDLNNIIVTNGADNPVEGIAPIEENQFTEDISLDVVNWNVNWLGAPQMTNNKFGTREEHINDVAAKLIEMNADIYALQEVVVNTGGNALEDLLTEMNRLTGDDIFNGIYSPYFSFYWQDENPDYPPQCLAFIWKKSVISVNATKALLKDYASYNDFGYGRLPFLLDANVTLNGKTQRYMFINIHLKAQTGYSDVRASSMSLLKELLYVNYAENNVVLLGDYNVADKSGALGEIKEWGMYNDHDGDGICDFVHAAGNKNNGIEHILISNELYDELKYTPEYYWNKTINGTGVKLSDHYAYQTRLYVHEETGNIDPENDKLFSAGKYYVTMTTSDYQIIVDYVKNRSELAALDPSTYDDSEYYFGASAYYSNFDIRDGKHNNTFATWQDAVKTAICKALLPMKFPKAVVDDSVYHVTFNTYSGENGTSTFNFICTKDAPDPEFEFTTRTANKELFTERVKVYPNPALDQITILSDLNYSSYAIYNVTGQLIQYSKNRISKELHIDINDFDKGIYILKMYSTQDAVYTTNFIKQ